MSGSTTLALIAGRDPDRFRNDGHLTYLRAHARAAIRVGYEPQILCVGSTASVRETEIGTIRRAFSPSRRPRSPWLPLHGPILVRALERLARERGGPLLVHGFGSWSWAGVRGCVRLRARGARAVAVASAYDTHPAAKARDAQGLGRGAAQGRRLWFEAEVLWRRVIARYEGYAYRNAAAVFVNYDEVRRLILEHYGDQVPIERLPYGLEVDFASNGERPPEVSPAEVAGLRPRDAPLVVCVARLRPNKGVDVLIDALALARDRGSALRACIVGAGPLYEAYRRRVAEAGLADSVAMPGLVPYVEPYVRAADIYVQPSRAEHSGSMALLEALRVGAPAIASRIDGIPEDVEDGESALLVAPNQPEELARALVRLARDGDLRQSLARGGHERFEEQFSADRFAEALGAAYSRLGFEP